MLFLNFLFLSTARKPQILHIVYEPLVFTTRLCLCRSVSYDLVFVFPFSKCTSCFRLYVVYGANSLWPFVVYDLCLILWPLTLIDYLWFTTLICFRTSIIYDSLKHMNPIFYQHYLRVFNCWRILCQTVSYSRPLTTIVYDFPKYETLCATKLVW